jgi:hypothetical protein
MREQYNKLYEQLATFVLNLLKMSKNSGFPLPMQWSQALFPRIFILRLYRIFLQKVLLLRLEDISSMEECKIPVWVRHKVLAPTEGFSMPWTAIFQRRASFWVAFVTVF